MAKREGSRTASISISERDVLIKIKDLADAANEQHGTSVSYVAVLTGMAKYAIEHWDEARSFIKVKDWAEERAISTLLKREWVIAEDGVLRKIKHGDGTWG